MSRAEFLGYLPYLLTIGTALAWYVAGLARDALAELRNLLRKRGLRVMDASGQRPRVSPLRLYLGQWGSAPRRTSSIG